MVPPGPRSRTEPAPTPAPAAAVDPVEPDETPTEPPAATRPAKDRHLHQIDLVRIVTFAAVILDHVMLGPAAPQGSSTVGGVGVILRYTRYSFFALTGFVLTYQYRHRELEVVPFWRRRFKLIGLPFVVWSLFYWLYGHYTTGGVANIVDTVRSAHAAALAAKSLAYDLITGTAWYHLYFLSVSMQIYLVFPAALWVLRRTWGKHRYLLAASFAFHAVLLYLMVRPQHGIFTHGVVGLVWRHLEVTIFPYQFFILSGAIAAMHFEAFQAFARRRRMQVFAVGAAVVAGTLGYFLYLVHHGEPMFRATNVFMLHNTFAYVAIIAMLYCVGTLWQERRTPGSVPARFLTTAADRSFGIYLAHALALDVVQSTLVRDLHTNSAVLIIVDYLATVAVTIVIVEALRRSPLSLVTTGRSMIDPGRQDLIRSALVGLAAAIVGVTLRYTASPLTGTALLGAGALMLLSAAWVTWRRHATRPPAPVG
ncbi:acyltransferase [Williamsia deligens]|uniref:Acyltransferase n=1 Tax=Williamsia deligens TaxID=321325 RepID=A0ABW3G7W4_9NOCA|nr:acyltransferase [Williamsia deligens]MCP2193023.1 Peptidoglycan/LPS O-acetylase OafA/YrhL, contains acyltransferase and SGNH-hydrolase domains [Williamsia deligens]